MQVAMWKTSRTKGCRSSSWISIDCRHIFNHRCHLMSMSWPAAPWSRCQWQRTPSRSSPEKWGTSETLALRIPSVQIPRVKETMGHVVTLAQPPIFKLVKKVWRSWRIPRIATWRHRSQAIDDCFTKSMAGSQTDIPNIDDILWIGFESLFTSPGGTDLTQRGLGKAQEVLDGEYIQHQCKDWTVT